MHDANACSTHQKTGAPIAHNSLSCGRRNSMREGGVLVSTTSCRHWPVLWREKPHPVQRGAKARQSPLLAVGVATPLFAHSQQNLTGWERGAEP